ncbi:MAG TPA: DUF2442 domain-containing protein [Candidatus Hydrogenedentes bacterium]|nr:DUF2442 domain-containing protein [Candidatus Hydrogenedentota bacterium]
MERIVEAKPLDNYRVKVTTASGLTGIFDVKPYLGGSVFQELKDPTYFKRVRVERYGISWPHEQDFSSDTIIFDIQAAEKAHDDGIMQKWQA